MKIRSGRSNATIRANGIRCPRKAAWTIAVGATARHACGTHLSQVTGEALESRQPGTVAMVTACLPDDHRRPRDPTHYRKTPLPERTHPR